MMVPEFAEPCCVSVAMVSRCATKRLYAATAATHNALKS